MFHNTVVKISEREKMTKQNLLKICLQVTFTSDFCIICFHFFYGKKGFSLLWFEPRSDHIWESQVLLTDGLVVFPRVLRFSPTFEVWSARYKWNILERAIKHQIRKQRVKAWTLIPFITRSHILIPSCIVVLWTKNTTDSVSTVSASTLHTFCETTHYSYILSFKTCHVPDCIYSTPLLSVFFLFFFVC